MTKKVKSFKHNEPPVTALVMRMVEVRRELANEETKTVPVVIATENPVERYDESNSEYYAEILSMDGVKFRTSKNQLPIVDSHDRSTTRNVLGSVRNIRVEGTELVGDAMFARDTDSQIAYQKLLDGHLTDFSITATPNIGKRVRRGESFVLRNQEIQGPAVIVTDWTPTDASLVAAGADETSTVRELLRSYQVRKETKRMLTEEMKAALVAKGMPEQLATAEEALAWATGVLGAVMPSQPVEPVASAEPVEVEEPEAEMPVVENADMVEPMDKEEIAKEATKRALQEDLKRRKVIRDICTAAKIERAFADELADDHLVTVDIARQKVLEKIMSQPIGTSGGRVEVVANGQEKFESAVRDGLISRALQSSGAKKYDKTQFAPGYRDFENMGLLRMAEETLRRQGVDTSKLNTPEIARIAVGDPKAVERARRAGIIRDAYHTTGTFANLMLDASNKTLLAGYEEAPYTWNLWGRQAPSVADFKNINRVRFSESPNLEMVPENADYKEGVMTDSKETYKVEKFGRVFTVSWETVVNDDLDAISRIPQMHGAAARRTQNVKFYEVLTSNPTMGDSNALFSASHTSGSNLSGADADPAVGTLNTAFAAMMKQKGMSSDVVLNVVPRYLIVPVALAATAEQLVSSTSYIVANGNQGVQNIYGPGGSRPLMVIAEPQLDANSTARWYLAADSAQIDTVELSFLQGEESPVLESEWDFNKDVWKYKVRQTFGVKAIDWRGLYKYGAS